MTRHDPIAVALFAAVVLVLIALAVAGHAQPAGLGWCPRNCGVWG